MGGRGRGRGYVVPRNRANRAEVITQRSIIVGLHAGGTSKSEIARRLGISRRTVQLWVQRYEEEGNVLTRRRPGRPRVSSGDDDARLVEAAVENPLTTAVALTRDVPMPCHPVTTRRRLVEYGLQCYVPAVKETLTEVNKAARLTFAQENIHHGLDFWRKVIFSDEKCFTSVSARGRQCWRMKNTRFQAKNIFERTRSGRVTVSLHGWMWYGGPGELVDIDGYLNGEEYINILETSFIPAVRAYAIPEPDPIWLVQDRSPIHTCRRVRDWFTLHPEIRLIEWPTKGCDCNPIENLWGIMVQEWGVEEKTKASIVKKAEEVWEGMRRRPNICSRLVDSLPARLQSVIDAEGGWTKY